MSLKGGRGSDPVKKEFKSVPHSREKRSGGKVVKQKKTTYLLTKKKRASRERGRS